MNPLNDLINTWPRTTAWVTLVLYLAYLASVFQVVGVLR